MSQESYITVGQIHALPPPETRGDYTTAMCILEVAGYKDRKELAAFEFFSKAVEKLTSFKVGEWVSVDWNIKGRQANNGKYYTTLSGFKIERVPSHAAERPEETHERNRSQHEYTPRQQQSRQTSRRNNDHDDIAF